MSEEKTILNMHPLDFVEVINNIDGFAKFHNRDKVNELTTKLWNAISTESRKSFRPLKK